MDKQIEKEEMARIIAFDLCPNRRIHANYGEEAQCYSDNNFAECKEIKNVVDKLYNAGYRKIPENAVVLTQEEWATVHEQFAQAMYQKEVNTRKETAEKFAERLKTECFDGGIDDKWVTVSFSRLDEICKELTEGKE